MKISMDLASLGPLFVVLASPAKHTLHCCEDVYRTNDNTLIICLVLETVGKFYEGS